MENYQMKNKTENLVLNKIKNKYPNVLIKNQSTVPNVQWFADYLKTNSIETGLILNAKNPELPLTTKGYFRTIEFCLLENKGKKITFIDAKKFDIETCLTDVILAEITTRIPFKSKYNYLFVIKGNGFTAMKIKQIQNTIQKSKKKIDVADVEYVFN